jgi:hypothetical protein
MTILGERYKLRSSSTSSLLQEEEFLQCRVTVIKSRRLILAGYVARMEKSSSSFKLLTGKPTRKRPLGRSRRRGEDNIRMNLEEIGINTSNWVDSAQDRD